MNEIASDIRASWIEPGDPRWPACLSTIRHDVYHTPDYVRVCAQHAGAEPIAILIESQDGSLLAPLLLQELPGSLGAPAGWRDSVSPYGYASPLMTPGVPDELQTAMFRRLQVCARERDIVCCFFRLNPVLALKDQVLRCAGDIVDHGQTVSIDLQQDGDVLTAQMRKSHRYEIRKLRRDGFAAQIGDWSRLGEFASTYLESMDRLGASQSLRFPECYFVGLQMECAENFHFCTVLSPSGELACAGLFAETCGIVQFHLAATAQDYRASAPSKLMLDEVCHWARSRGNDVFHLGGGVGNREDALFRFKAGFSKDRNRYATFRVVADAKRYETLCERWRNVNPAAAIDEEFFPLYRQAAR